MIPFQDCPRHCRLALFAWHLPQLPVDSHVPVSLVPQIHGVYIGWQRSLPVSLAVYQDRCLHADSRMQFVDGERIPSIRDGLFPQSRPWTGLIFTCRDLNRAYAGILCEYAGTQDLA